MFLTAQLWVSHGLHNPRSIFEAKFQQPLEFFFLPISGLKHSSLNFKETKQTSEMDF